MSTGTPLTPIARYARPWVSAPTIVPFDGTRITKPVQFFVRGNYAAFVKRYEMTLYRSSDADLVSPLAQFPINVANVTQADSVVPSRMVR